MTFDFHNTLIECDEWFNIEVHTLVSDVLRYWHDLGEIDVPPAVLANADAEYRKLRLAIHVHGHELPADRAVRMILDKIGYLVRERFKIWGQVQALTGEGRLSGIVLLALPPLLFVAVYRLNPEYVLPLFTDPMGRKMLAGGIVMQLLGAIVIKKIVNIKV